MAIALAQGPQWNMAGLGPNTGFLGLGRPVLRGATTGSRVGERVAAQVASRRRWRERADAGAARGDGLRARLRPDGGAPRGRPAGPAGAAVALLGSNGAGKTRCQDRRRAPAGPEATLLFQGSSGGTRAAPCRPGPGWPDHRGPGDLPAASRCGRTSPCRSADATSTARWRRPPPASPSSASAWTRWRGRCRVVSSRCWPSPGPSHRPRRGPGRRAVGGPGAGRRRRDLPRRWACCGPRERVAAPGGSSMWNGRRDRRLRLHLQKGEIVFVGDRHSALPEWCSRGNLGASV